MSIGFGSDTATVGVDELLEQFERDVPCDTCDSPAELRSDCHSCACKFKCLRCWQKWLQQELDRNHRLGRDFFLCGVCWRKFPSVEAFSDYRPF